MDLESDCDINCNRCARNDPQKGLEELEIVGRAETILRSTKRLRRVLET